MDIWGRRRSGSGHHVRVADLDLITCHGSNDGMATRVLTDGAKGKLAILGSWGVL